MRQLVSIDAVRPSTYNPRITDPERLEFIKLSLRKLGFLLPIYADVNGEIVSGHQRHLAASELGWTHVPVEYTPPMDLQSRQNVNIVFNRATNDFRRHEDSQQGLSLLQSEDIVAMGEKLPDKEGDDRFPCLRSSFHDIELFLSVNFGRWNDHARNLARSLNRRKIIMPIVAKHDYAVVNGIGRIQFLAEEEIRQVEVIFVSDAEAEFAEPCSTG